MTAVRGNIGLQRVRVVGAVVGVTVASLVGCNSLDEPAAGPAYFYITTGELVLSRDSEQVASIPQSFSRDEVSRNLAVWTNSGDYLAVVTWRVDLDPAKYGVRTDVKLTFVDTHSGKLRSTTCDCEIVAPAGDNDVLVTIDGSSNIARVSPESTGSGIAVPLAVHRLPRGYNTSEPVVLGELGERLVTKQTWTPNLEEQQYQRAQFQMTPIDGSPEVEVVADNIDTYHVSTAIADPRGGRTSMAIRMYGHGGGCASGTSVAVLDQDGSWTETDLSGAAPPGFVVDVQGGFSVTDMTWSAIDRRFHASIDSWQCSGDGSELPLKYVGDDQQWVLQGEQWTQDNTWPEAEVVHQMSADTWLVLDKPVCVEGSNDCLYGAARIEHADGTSQTLADDVIQVSVGP